MTIDVSHQKNPAIGWDVNTVVTADKREKIAHVVIRVNGIPECNEDVSPAASSWKKNLVQQGSYPGANKVVVTATNEKGEDTDANDEWS